jgi:hypothetical protein
MSDTNRKIIIDGDSSGFEEMMSKIAQAGQSTYQILTEQAEKHTKVLSEMTQKFDEYIKKLDDAKKSGSGGDGGGNDNGGGNGGGGSRIGGFAKGVGQGLGAGVGLGAVMSVGSAISSIFSLGNGLDVAQSSLMAMTGSGSIGSRLFDYGDVGINSIDATNMRKSTAQTMGTTVGSVEQSYRQAQFERATGLEIGTTSSLQQYARQGANYDEIMGSFLSRAMKSSLWDIEVGNDGALKIGDVSAMNEDIGFMSTMLSTQMGTMGAIDEGSMASLFTQLRGVEGFDAQNFGQNFQSLNEGITNQGNPFASALIQSAIAKANPGLDMLGMEKKLSEGIQGNGTLEAVLEDLRTITKGDNNEMQLMLKRMFTGMDWKAIEALSKSKTGDFANWGGSETSLMGKLGVEAEAGTGSTQQVVARLETLLARIGKAIIEKLAPTAEKILAWLMVQMDRASAGYEEYKKSREEGQGVFASLGDALEVFEAETPADKEKKHKVFKKELSEYYKARDVAKEYFENMSVLDIANPFSDAYKKNRSNRDAEYKEYQDVLDTKDYGDVRTAFRNDEFQKLLEQFALGVKSWKDVADWYNANKGFLQNDIPTN